MLTVSSIGLKGIKLGALYSDIEETILPGESLWSEDDIEKMKVTVYDPESQTKEIKAFRTEFFF